MRVNRSAARCVLCDFESNLANELRVCGMRVTKGVFVALIGMSDSLCSG